MIRICTKREYFVNGGDDTLYMVIQKQLDQVHKCPMYMPKRTLKCIRSIRMCL